MFPNNVETITIGSVSFKVEYSAGAFERDCVTQINHTNNYVYIANYPPETYLTNTEDIMCVWRKKCLSQTKAYNIYYLQSNTIKMKQVSMQQILDTTAATANQLQSANADIARIKGGLFIAQNEMQNILSNNGVNVPSDLPNDVKTEWYAQYYLVQGLHNCLLQITTALAQAETYMKVNSL